VNHDLLRKLTLIEANKIPGVKLWPNPVGLGMVGKVVKRYTQNKKSYCVIENPRPVKFGLAKGSADLIGFQTIKIGEISVARFIAPEIKVGKDKLRPEQENYQNVVNNHGGNAFVVQDSVSGLVDLLGRPLKSE